MQELVGGRFEIEREAGAGAMARVYRARDAVTDKVVALKIINGVDDHVMRRFAREVDALVGLDHSGIVGYVHHGRTSAGQAFLAMEWVEGQSLEARLERGTLSCAEALALGRKVASALGVAHARGVVHRDIKPANIILVGGDAAVPKLLDFGLVRDLEATLALTSTGDLLGTPLFMAPEQASSDPTLDARVDVYALGAVLFNCITGRPPIVATNLVALLAKIVLDEPPPVSKLAADVPVVVEELFAQLLAKKREGRPRDGRAAEALIARTIDELAGSRPRRAATALPVREQRVCTILLASQQQSASEVSLDATLGSLGGALSLADGSTMVVFDGPETPGDLASRAARYALGLRTSSASVSVATGSAVLSGPMPMGEVIERAAGQLATARGAIRIDADTAALIEGRFELSIDELGAQLVGERAGELDPVRTLLGKPTRCIGRDRELAVIEGYFAEVIGESAARVVIVIADAGVGKSRVAHELQRRLAGNADAPRVLVARCESITRNSPFAAAATVLRRAAGIDPNDPPAQREARLATLLAKDGITDPDVSTFLAELLGIPAQAPSERLLAARENPSLMFDAIRGAWTTWLARIAAQGPLLLVVEDLHWADDSSILLVDAALGALAEAPFMVLALARPEVRDRKPWAARRPHELPLDPLARRASERMVREALGEAATDAIVAGIVARAGGNALFLEELIRVGADSADSPLPVGVVGTVQRRFDALGPEARGVLRAASIFGEQFTAAGLAALLPDRLAVPAALDELVAEELIARHADGFGFRHGLVREAAYALLPDQDRALGHVLAAQFLERGDTNDPVVIARHFELGAANADAARWYTRATEHALGRNDLKGALAHVERAQRWTEDIAALGRLDLLGAEIELWRGRLDRAREAAQRAVQRLPEASAEWFEAAGLIITSSGQLGDNELVEHWLTHAMELEPPPDARSAYVLCLARGSSQLAWTDRAPVARRALARAEAVPHDAMGPGAQARLQFARAYDFVQDGRIDACVRILRDVAATYTRVGSARDALQATMLAHMLSMFAGELEYSPAILRGIAEEAERLEAHYLADWTRWEIAIALLMLGKRDAAEAELASVPPRVAGQPLFHDVTAVMRAWCAFRDDDVDGIDTVVVAAAPRVTYSRFRAALDAFTAYVQVRRGDVAGGCQRARAAIDALLTAPGLQADGCLVGFAPALDALVRSSASDAADAVRGHVARLDGIAALLGDEMRDGFRLRVPWNRYVLSLHERLS